jgi:acyl-CoA reductase-like NAD-dependent aldehyde dehydrogenase
MDTLPTGLFIGGTLRASRSRNALEALNPATGEVIGKVADASVEDVADAVSAAAKAAPAWAETPARRRGQILLAIAARMRQRGEELARLDSLDSGRTIAETRAQVERSAQQCEYCAGAADKLEGRVVPLGGTSFAHTALEPYGVVAALTPWNAPLLQIAQKASHALATGNAVVVKPSPLACFTAHRFAEIAVDVGLAPGVLNVITGGAVAGSALVADERVAKVTFTGSTATGHSIAAVCGARGASVSLELGGKCPLLVFGDANLAAAATLAGRAAFGSAGQSCVAAARILVERRCLSAFLPLLARETERWRGGDPFAPSTAMGPLISRAAWLRVRDLVRDAVARGASLAAGTLPGDEPHSAGFFMDALALRDVAPEARITREEAFGPVSVIEVFDTEDEAAAKANAGPYGLAAGICTDSAARARRLTRKLTAGNVWVNTYKALDPAMPFGGNNASGINRECGIDGLLSFVRPKAIVEAY